MSRLKNSSSAQTDIQSQSDKECVDLLILYATDRAVHPNYKMSVFLQSNDLDHSNRCLL